MEKKNRWTNELNLTKEWRRGEGERPEGAGVRWRNEDDEDNENVRRPLALVTRAEDEEQDEDKWDTMMVMMMS